MGLGSFPASDPQFLGMLGMHGTYEANLAMHGCDVLLAVGARFDDRVTGRLNAFSQGSKKIHIDIDPSSINKNVPVDVPIVADAGRALAALLAAWHADPTPVDTPRADRVVAADRRLAREGQPEIHPGHEPGRDHQAAIRDPAAVRADSRGEAGHLHHHRGRPAPDVGRAALQVRAAEPLDDLAAAWAPWAMGCRRRWACRSRIPMRW